MWSMVCTPHPSQPANIPASGWVRGTTEILVDYEGSCLYGVASMHPSWSSYSTSWGQCRTSGCHPSSRPGPLCSHMDCVTFGWHQCPASPGDGPSHCHTYRGHSLEMLLEGVQSVTSIWCLLKAVLPRSRSQWADRSSHLSSHSLACSSVSGHSPRPWRSRASKISLLGVAGGPPRFLLGGPLVVLCWQAQLS